MKLLTVREARNRAKPRIRQVDLARSAKVDQTYISLIERGLRIPSSDLQVRLANALRVALSPLRFGHPGAKPEHEITRTVGAP